MLSGLRTGTPVYVLYKNEPRFAVGKVAQVSNQYPPQFNFQQPLNPNNMGMMVDLSIEVDGKTVNATPWDNGDTGENNDTAEDGTDSAEKMTDSAADSDKDFYGNGVYLFNIPQGKDKHNVVITAYDAAGNKSELQVNDIIVTTSALVLWFNNTPLFIGSILVGVALIAGIIIFISALSRRKKA